MKRIHIQNGHLIDPKNKKNGKADLVVENGKIRDVLKAGEKVADAQVIDAKGLIVAPGFIDLHTHLREPGQEYKETIQTGTQSAAAGGFTSICCMANTDPVNDRASVTDFILKQAREKGIVNVYPIGALTRGLKGQELADYAELKRAGCVAVSDDGMCVENNRVMRYAMEYAKSFGLPVITHSIDPCFGLHGVMNESFVSTKLGLPGIPNEAEDIMISRDIYLAKLTGAQLHIAHVSTAEGVELVKRAKSLGIKVTCEVTPHHLALNDECVSDYDPNTKMAPPLRAEIDRKALLDALISGVIDAVATDHAPHALVDKEVEFDCAANGIVGLESALGVVLNLVEKKMPLDKLLETLTVNPARVVGLDKGHLSVGADADIVLFDPNEAYKIDPAQFSSKSKNSPFLGTPAKGRVKFTLVSGKVVYTYA